jgi:hypothetical protein
MYTYCLSKQASVAGIIGLNNGKNLEGVRGRDQLPLRHVTKDVEEHISTPRFRSAEIRTWELPKRRECATNESNVRRVSAPMVLYVCGSDAICVDSELLFQEGGHDFPENRRAIPGTAQPAILFDRQTHLDRVHGQQAGKMENTFPSNVNSTAFRMHSDRLSSS